MRIIYNKDVESDYYDCMQKYTQDRDTTYTRKPLCGKTFSFSKGYGGHTQHIGLGNLSPKYSEYDATTFIIGFCGELFLCLKKESRIISHRYRHKEISYHYGYDNIIEQIKICHESPTKFASRRLKAWELKMPVSYNDAIKKAIEGLKEDFVKELFDIAPIWTLNRGYYHDELYTENDPLLKTFNFQTVYGVQEAYQKLESYLYNVARPIKPIPEISDEIMAAAKGFDKFSFRKDRSKRR